MKDYKVGCNLLPTALLVVLVWLLIEHWGELNAFISAHLAI